MAIYEYQAIFASKNKIETIKPSTLRDVLEEDSWLDPNVDNDINSELSLYFKQGKNWHEETKVWLENESKIQIFCDDNVIYEIRLRLDLRYRDINILEKFIEIAQRLNYSIISIFKDFNIFEPSIDNILDDIKISPAYKFVKNPSEYLDYLSKNPLILDDDGYAI